MPATAGSKTHGAFTIPSLDGIRAVAVLIVFVGHTATMPGLWPGHVGVTIFFFLSGYLITTLLRREHEKTSRISLPKFYLRRALRILPPAYLAIGAGVLVGAIGLLPATTTGWGVLAEVLNYTNYYLVFEGREGLPPETSMLWSLAVEEHFYLIFPALLIVLLWRKLSMRTIALILMGACALAPIWRIILTAQGADFFRLYTSTDTRFDALLFGAAMALLFNPAVGDRAPLGLSDRSISRLVPVALLVFAATAVVDIPQFRLTIADTIQIMCLVPIFWFVIAQPNAWAGKILNNRWLAHIGVLSFSVYLFHRLAISITGAFIPIEPVADALAFLLTLVVAELVYRLVEVPLGRLRRKLETRAPGTRLPPRIGNRSKAQP
ncbi:acyltransferase family protein [Plantibacter cousiniae (nom. nud.)]|uniref:acyltransferase family protein n=1 Tax=Plantibacter cousiniae (nom. nud.) TaxID=199709 RepID=UPI001D5D619B|nr:acyltransferase [Plantibacter cousiniae]CAH0255944.1 O-acetyltransferase OatA [Plantibacter cousiniae]